MSECKTFFNRRIKGIMLTGLLSCLIVLVIQCNHSYAGNVQLKMEIFFFVTAKESGLSGAINNVTQKRKSGFI